MERRVTQETFDAAVQENAEEFGMGREEALRDAVQQFRSQGVDLSSIDTSGGIGRAEFEAAMRALRSHEAPGENLDALRELCSDSCEWAVRNKNMFASTAGLSVLRDYLNTSEPASVLVKCFNTMIVVCKNMESNTDQFEPEGSRQLMAVLSHYAPLALATASTETSASETAAKDAETVLAAGFRLAKLMCKSENNKVALMRAKIGALIGDILKDAVKPRGTSSTGDDTTRMDYLHEVCLCIKGLSIHDDLRREMSSAYDNGKFFLSADEVVANLLTLAKNFQQQPRLASASLSALKQLVLSEEAVQIVCLHGAMELPRAVMHWSEAPINLVRAVAGLMRNLCADDNRKNKLVADGTLHELVRCLHVDQYATDAQFMENAAACLAAISLRSPSNSTVIMDSGALEPLVAGMRKHRDKEVFQRQACLTIRNIAARGTNEIKSALLDMGIEGVLRAAGSLQGAVDEAYAALRDLNCEVQFVKIGSGGSALPVYEQFGTGKKLQFNPVFEETSDINDRVNQEARAPFARIDEDAEEESGGRIAAVDKEEEGSCCSHGGEHHHDHDHGHEHGHGHDAEHSCC